MNCNIITSKFFIDTLDLEFYIDKVEDRNQLADFLVDLSSENAKKRLIIFYGENNTGKSSLLNNIIKLFSEQKHQSSKKWLIDDFVLTNYHHLLQTINSSMKCKDIYNCPLFVSTYKYSNKQCQDKSIKLLLKDEPIEYIKKYKNNGTSYIHCEYTSCNILKLCNELPTDQTILDKATIIEFSNDISKLIQSVKELSRSILDEVLIPDITNIIIKYYNYTNAEYYKDKKFNEERI
jgi:GTPase SAR1 family protein